RRNAPWFVMHKLLSVHIEKPWKDRDSIDDLLDILGPGRRPAGVQPRLALGQSTKVDPLSLVPGVVLGEPVPSAPQRHPDGPGPAGAPARREGPGDRPGTGASAHTGRSAGASRRPGRRDRHPAGDD